MTKPAKQITLDKFTNNQGVINGKITNLIDKPEELKEFMKGKTDEQKRLGRIHAKTVKALRIKND